MDWVVDTILVGEGGDEIWLKFRYLEVFNISNCYSPTPIVNFCRFNEHLAINKTQAIHSKKRFKHTFTPAIYLYFLGFSNFLIVMGRRLGTNIHTCIVFINVCPQILEHRNLSGLYTSISLHQAVDFNMTQISLIFAETKSWVK